MIQALIILFVCIIEIIIGILLMVLSSIPEFNMLWIITIPYFIFTFFIFNHWLDKKLFKE